MPDLIAASVLTGRLGAGPSRGIVRITRHPFLFGSLLVLAVGGTASIDAKRRRLFGEQWSQFAAVTSALPFAAIAAGRNRPLT